MEEKLTEIVVTIIQIEGEPIRFQIKLTSEARQNLAARIEGMLDSRYFGVDIDGKLTIVPFHNIRMIEIEPAPDVLIRSVVRNAVALPG